MSLLKRDHQNPSSVVKTTRTLRYEVENIIIVAHKLYLIANAIEIDIQTRYVIIIAIASVITFFLNY